jgi:hypothetical protein
MPWKDELPYQWKFQPFARDDTTPFHGHPATMVGAKIS